MVLDWWLNELSRFWGTDLVEKTMRPWIEFMPKVSITVNFNYAGEESAVATEPTAD